MQKLSELRSGPPKARPGEVHVVADTNGQPHRDGPTDNGPVQRAKQIEGDGVAPA